MGFLSKMKTAFGGDDSDLMANGVPGRGEILNVQITGSSVQVGGAPPQQVCVFQVMVYLDDTPPFQAEVRKRVPVYALANLQPGQSVVAVRVDPADHTRVGIDFSVEPPVVRLAKTPGKITAAEVLEKGDPCEAVIVQFQPLGVKNTIGLDMYAFMLTVMIPGQAPYQIQVGNPVLPEALPLLYPGSRVPAKIMPNTRPDNLVIDWKAALAKSASG
ncbi:MAG: hypothetical protein ACM32E_21290 [Gemmatimonadota bacterium]